MGEHTLPDYSTKYKMTKVFSQVDIGELAARLGSIDIFDRRGNVVFMEDFEGPVLQWEIGGGAGSVQALTTAKARSGSQSCILTAQAGLGGNAYIRKHIGGDFSGNIGAECSFILDSDTTTLAIEFRYYTGANVWAGYIWYQLAANRFQYQDSGGVLRNLITDLILEDTLDTWHTMKLVLDSTNNEYVRFMIDDHEESMAALGLMPDDSLLGPHLYLEVVHVSSHAAAKSVYIDNVILTQNEG